MSKELHYYAVFTYNTWYFKITFPNNAKIELISQSLVHGFLGPVSNHVIFRVRAPRMVSRLGRLRQLSNGFGVFPLSRRGTAQVQKTARAREYAATSPLSRVTAAAFLSPASTILPLLPPETTRVCVCFILCDRLPYTAYVESSALAWRLYQVPIVSQSFE